jgi:16S rRNA (adenine1518-N6/adenine1519-N6)-dimethyltransferase
MSGSTSLQSLLRRHGLWANRGLGQHFLRDEDVLQAVARAINPGPDSDVVEIGSGPGNLTMMLSLSGAKVTGIEMDRRFVPLHNELIATNPDFDGRLQFHYGDALDFDYLAAATAAREAGRRFLIAGNIPYQITSPLIMKVLEDEVPFEAMALMMQREVAERLRSAPGSKQNGSITIKVQFYAEVDHVVDVPPESFVPPPKVESEVVLFRPKLIPADLARDKNGRPAFFRLVDAAFMHRRKTLPNSLVAASYGTTREQAEAALQSINLPPTTRAEQLGLDQYQTLHAALNK